MNNVKLTIFTGVQDTDIIDLGLYNPSIEGILSMAVPDPKEKLTFSGYIDYLIASELSPILQVGIDDIASNNARYSPFQIADLLAAKDYLAKLKIACDTYPACTVRIEPL